MLPLPRQAACKTCSCEQLDVCHQSSQTCSGIPSCISVIVTPYPCAVTILYCCMRASKVPCRAAIRAAESDRKMDRCLTPHGLLLSCSSAGSLFGLGSATAAAPAAVLACCAASSMRAACTRMCAVAGFQAPNSACQVGGVWLTWHRQTLCTVRAEGACRGFILSNHMGECDCHGVTGISQR